MYRYMCCTLVQIMHNDAILLGMKKRGLGVGKWNGFGGKVQKDETLKQCCVREVFEECSLQVQEEDLKQIGILMFDFVNENLLLEVNVFKTYVFTGTPAESEEMKPKWFTYENIPYSTMWVDDILWYPLMFNGDLFYGVMKFCGHDNMLSNNLQTVKNIAEMQQLRKYTVKEYSVESPGGPCKPSLTESIDCCSFEESQKLSVNEKALQ